MSASNTDCSPASLGSCIMNEENISFTASSSPGNKLCGPGNPDVLAKTNNQPANLLHDPPVSTKNRLMSCRNH
jgi:hypothetical protein